MSKATDVVVIGGGVVGTSAAYFLSSAGAQVTVVEKEDIAAGSSGHGPGFFNAFGGDFSPGPHLALGLESIRLIRENMDHLKTFEDEPGWFNDRPGLAPAFTDEVLANLRDMYAASGAQLEAAGAGAVWLEADEIRRHEPLLAPSVLGGYLFGSVIQIDGWKLARLYMSAARHSGAKLQIAEVIGLTWESERASGVRLADGSTIECDHVVIAMGSWTPTASVWLGFPLPMCNLKGQLHVLRIPGDLALKHHVIERIALMQYPNGDFLLAATPDPAPGGGLRPTDAYIRPVFETHALPDDTQLLLDTGLERFPFLRKAEVIKDLAGGRPMSVDLLPMIGTTPAFDNVYVASGHGRKGIHLSAATGKLVSDLVLSGSTELNVDADAYSPMRFMPPKM
ncbi:FAD-binding oxidoreductase [Jatrophihabitans cynanchi]|uniref:FAD-binding oxidoreductase n=1 Tax=Jatrophihabitans cynanchi TaxID=2944128 RepID=A0ABY7K2V3_9ACTN|nr:FAD-dependent oxidoreductase [Jatrophihabitans sp. SB3-54]WAX58335.1 FAD-binding oxidoreductase [Jatrophihabitans sp. SB3-54]